MKIVGENKDDGMMISVNDRGLLLWYLIEEWWRINGNGNNG